MSERFVDRKDKKELINSCPDFKLRRHGIPPLQVVYAFIAALLAVVMLVGHLVIKLLFLPDNIVTPTDEILSILFAIAFCIAAVAVFAVALIYRIRDIILETEFQNLIFASASRAGTDFCLIVNSDKTTIYADYNFSQLFASFENQIEAFSSLLADKGFKKTERDKIVKAMKSGKSAKASLSFASSADGPLKKYAVVVEPITRPAGYYLVRGSEAGKK